MTFRTLGSTLALATVAGCAVAPSATDPGMGKHRSEADLHASFGKADARLATVPDLQPDSPLRVTIPAGPEGAGRWQTVRIHARPNEQLDAWVKSVGQVDPIAALVDDNGAQLAWNDDVDQSDWDSRILVAAPGDASDTYDLRFRIYGTGAGTVDVVYHSAGLCQSISSCGEELCGLQPDDCGGQMDCGVCKDLPDGAPCRLDSECHSGLCLDTCSPPGPDPAEGL
jgi:hypothetical protein